ncbi:MAG TPA: glutamyl-tRNA reductase [Gemmatimonadaceae bacterium]|nr:glutamyl-tRNA reductase [Gemmatimonadaceae bacterium]
MISSLAEAIVTPSAEPRSHPGGRPGAAADPDVESVTCVGVSFRTAPLDLRERLALSKEQVAALLARTGCGADAKRLSELVVLSTCNRLELYAPGGDGATRILTRLIADATGVSEGELAPVLYDMHGGEAVRHLCRLAGGLESMIVGEPQILGQISDAYALALAQGSAGHAMGALFRGAIRAGRRARTETAINHNPATVSSAAVKLVTSVVPDLENAQVLIVGSGEMAELALSALHYRGVPNGSACVLSRTREHAGTLADRFGDRMESLERLRDALAAADIVVTSTSAPHHVITTEMVYDVMVGQGRTRPLAIVDIAVPRDVEPSAAEVAGVTYFDLDSLERSVSAALGERDAEIPKVEAIVEEEAEELIGVLRQLDVEPLIADLRSRLEEIRQDALYKARRQIGQMSDGDRAQIEAFSTALVNKLFHEPTCRLRAEARRGQAAGYALAIRQLFGLS